MFIAVNHAVPLGLAQSKFFCCCQNPFAILILSLAILSFRFYIGCQEVKISQILKKAKKSGWTVRKWTDIKLEQENRWQCQHSQYLRWSRLCREADVNDERHEAIRNGRPSKAYRQWRPVLKLLHQGPPLCSLFLLCATCAPTCLLWYHRHSSECNVLCLRTDVDEKKYGGCGPSFLFPSPEKVKKRPGERSMLQKERRSTSNFFWLY